MKVYGEQVLAPDGAVGTPGLSFLLDPDTGLFRPGANRLQLVTNATARWEVDANGDFIPNIDDTYNIGSATKEVEAIFANQFSTSGGSDWATLLTPYSPALTAVTTNPVLGSTGTAVGRYFRMGDWIKGWADFEFGGAGVAAGTGAYRISIPFAIDTILVLRSVTGICFYRDSSAASNQSGQNNFQTATTLALKDEAGADVGAAAPWTWATGDEIHCEFSYPAA